MWIIQISKNNLNICNLVVDNKGGAIYCEGKVNIFNSKLSDNRALVDGGAIYAVGAGENVTFNINGVFYTRTTNATGHVSLNINLPEGNLIITTSYKGCNVANNVEVLSLLSANDIKMRYRDGSQFIAKLVDGQGYACPNQYVTFNINGVFYNRITDNNGLVKLNIRLIPGEYIITSSFNGCSIANRVTVTF